MKNTKGFTLIELLVVVLIIGILAAMALPQYFKAVEKSKSAEAIQVLGTLAQAEQRYYLQHDVYTKDMSKLDIDFTGADGNPAKETLNTNNFKITVGTTLNEMEKGYAIAARIKYGSSGDALYTITRCFANGNMCCSGNGNTRVNCDALGFTTDQQKAADACCLGGTVSGGGDGD